MHPNSSHCHVVLVLLLVLLMVLLMLQLLSEVKS